jgi:hypothetical protein
MIKRKFFLNAILGISTEVCYALFIMLAALLICFLINLKI